MAVKHIVYLRTKSSLSAHQGDELIKELNALIHGAHCSGGAAGRNYQTENANFQFAMAFDFANKADAAAFEESASSKAFTSKWAHYIEDASVVDFEY